MNTTIDPQDASSPALAARAPARLNEAVQASLAALEAARRAERRRRRRDRAVALVSAGLTASAIWGVTTRLRTADGAVPPRAQTPPAAVATAAEPPAVEEDLAAPAGPAEAQAEMAPQAAPDVAPAPASAAPTSAELEAACQHAGQRHNWRDVTVACAAVFTQKPDAERALTIAQAHYRRSQVAEAGAWADRALALNATLPEAFILRAYAAEHAGDEARAEAAYREYLSLAPRGWHASAAKTALARLK